MYTQRNIKINKILFFIKLFNRLTPTESSLIALFDYEAACRRMSYVQGGYQRNTHIYQDIKVGKLEKN